MGYRSDVRIRLTKEDFERLKEEFEKRLIETNELEYSMFKNLDIYKEESDKTIFIHNQHTGWEEQSVYSVYFGWNGVKWYNGYEDVDFITNFVFDCEQYAFIRIGESSEGDIENIAEGFDCIDFYYAFDDDEGGNV